MAADNKAKVVGAAELATALRDLAPNMRRGPALRALRAGAKPVLERAIAETPILAAPVYRNGKMIREPGTLRRALRIRTSKDTAKTGDVGVFVNYKPLERAAVVAFKNDTGRPGSENKADPFYWRWTIFSTKKNKNPKPALQNAGKIMQSVSVPLIVESLSAYFKRLNQRGQKK